MIVMIMISHSVDPFPKVAALEHERLLMSRRPYVIAVDPCEAKLHSLIADSLD